MPLIPLKKTVNVTRHFSSFLALSWCPKRSSAYRRMNKDPLEQVRPGRSWKGAGGRLIRPKRRRVWQINAEFKCKSMQALPGPDSPSQANADLWQLLNWHRSELRALAAAEGYHKEINTLLAWAGLQWSKITCRIQQNSWVKQHEAWGEHCWSGTIIATETWLAGKVKLFLKGGSQY